MQLTVDVDSSEETRGDSKTWEEGQVVYEGSNLLKPKAAASRLSQFPTAMDWKLKIAALLGAVAYWYSARNHLGSIEEQTIEGWRRQLGPPAKQYERVAVG